MEIFFYAHYLKVRRWGSPALTWQQVCVRVRGSHTGLLPCPGNKQDNEFDDPYSLSCKDAAERHRKPHLGTAFHDKLSSTVRSRLARARL